MTLSARLKAVPFVQVCFHSVEKVVPRIVSAAFHLLAKKKGAGLNSLRKRT
jgi:hypothetical protein